ncbi:hypothetical protein A9X84_07435 [Brachyspira hyodysenteriae]|nr:hypothetical protein SU46_01590 [Brachyspira hyodysenteriae]KLI35667.1 hypothetical protein SZ48_02065 [Brachyspira hyodysenteriae]KLI37429.1 hypothetical protein SZ51_09535 [Brachyspira hyodysenteriae]KLI51356.1 hypothetical protein SZ42_06100 [Brachyspira hyodysenteriae]TVL44437.1 hypothetical protein A9X84_07435 [Brachyspira hyodysenteriae]
MLLACRRHAQRGELRLWHAKGGQRPKEVGCCVSTQSGGQSPKYQNKNITLFFLIIELDF